MQRPQRPGPPRSETLRAALRAALRTDALTVRELSQRVGVSERDVLEHLGHLERSLAHTSERLSVEPAACRSCGYVFEVRRRLTKPGRCPACKSTRIALPRFHIAPA